MHLPIFILDSTVLASTLAPSCGEREPKNQRSTKKHALSIKIKKLIKKNENWISSQKQP